MSSVKEKIDLHRLPVHVAIIMDGNGRWALKQGNQRVFGHQNGVESVRQTVEACGELGIPFLSLYAFSKENWCRPQQEINALMSLMVSTIDSELDSLAKNKVKLIVLGDIANLPTNVQDKLLTAITRTEQNTGLNLVIALSYSSKWEITQAALRLALDIKENKLPAGAITEETFSGYLTTKHIPDPELLIRTGGEFRLSNFLLWQLAYTELYFSDILWPDFRKEDLYEAIIDFQKRERRFGKTSEQVKNCD